MGLSNLIGYTAVATFTNEATVPLWRIVVRINANDIACEWRRFFPQRFGVRTRRDYLYAEPARFDTMIICESMRIRHELNTNWYDAVRCNTMQHDGDTMQYEAVRWWWRINTIALWCDENTIGTTLIGDYMNQCEHVPSNTTMRSLLIALQRTESQQTGGESQCECATMRHECTTMRYEPIRTDTNWYDVRRCNTTQYE